jgi:hypothetical protein
MTETFYISLKIMALGMGGIFIFMLLFWLIIVLLQKFFPGKSEG